MTAKKEPKSRRIRALLSEGKSVAEIAATVGVTRQYVYGIAHLDRKKAKKVAPKRKYVRKAGRCRTHPYLHSTGDSHAPGGGGGTGIPVLVASYTPPVVVAPASLTWKQRFTALFTGRIA
jgi:hypothetical protein